MRGSFPRRVDPWRAGAAATQFEGILESGELPRLSRVAVPCEPVSVRLGFSQPDGASHELIQVAVQAKGRYALTCQRCLEPMELVSDVRALVLLASDERVARQFERSDDVVVSPPGTLIDLAMLVEDEILLALPFAPRHEPGLCRLEAVPGPAGDAAPDGSADQPGAQNAPTNPFAVLAALKHQRPDD